MYNEEQKMKFLTDTFDKESTIKCYASCFNLMSNYESKLQKDICEMTTDELSIGLKANNYAKYRSGCGMKSILFMYKTWCENNNIEYKADLSNVKFDLTSLFSKNYIGSPVELQEYMDKLFQIEPPNNSDLVYRCYMWLAYSGVPEYEIFKITSEHINLEKECVEYNGHKFPIYPISIPVFEKCVNLTEFVYINKYYEEPIKRARVDGDQLIRGIRSTQKVKGLGTYLTKRTKAAYDDGVIDFKLSYTKLWLSGLYYRTYMNELDGIEPDFSEVAKFGLSIRQSYEAMEEYSNSKLSESNIYQNKRSYKKDYKTWKGCFYGNNQT